MSSSNSPCAACKCRRQKCTQECVFAPYFPPDQPQKYINVHRVFGASNVAKLLNDLNASQREDAVNSLAYEAEHRLRDPVYGCVGIISILQHRLKQVQSDLYAAKKELASYVGPSALFPFIQPNFMTQQQHPSNPSPSTMLPYTMQPMMGMQPGMAAAHGGQVIIRDPQQQQMLEAQQMAAAAAVAAREQQEMLRSYEQNQQPQTQPEVMRFNSGFDTAGAAATASVSFNQMPVAGAGMSSSPLVFGSYENFTYHQMHQQQQQLPSDTSHSHPQGHQLQFQSQIMLQQQSQHNYTPQAHESQQSQATLQQPQRAKSEEDRSISPSC